jgi:hypothetical protein
VAAGPIVQACDHHRTGRERADPTDRAVGPSVPAQADRASAGLTDPALADLTDRERADQSDRGPAGQSAPGIAPKVPVSAGPNVLPRVLNARQNVPPYGRNVPRRAGRPTSGAGRQVRNIDGMQDHNNDPVHPRRTVRRNGNKAVHSNVHDHSHRHVRANITHVPGKVAAVVVVADEGIKAGDRSVRDLSRTQPRNEPLCWRRVRVRKADLSVDAHAR